MIEKIKSYVIDLCKGDYTWMTHIEAVVKYANELADLLDADKEIVEIAAWLHDIKKIQGEPELHHVYGAEEAGEILKKEGYDKVEQVKECILTHSSDQSYPPKTLEGEILANADALCHFDTFHVLIYRAVKFDNIPIEELRGWLLEKYEKTNKKITLPQAKKIAEPKYAAIKLLLGIS